MRSCGLQPGCLPLCKAPARRRRRPPRPRRVGPSLCCSTCRWGEIECLAECAHTTAHSCAPRPLPQRILCLFHAALARPAADSPEGRARAAYAASVLAGIAHALQACAAPVTAALDAHAAGGGGAALLLGGTTCPQWAPWALRAAEAQLLRLSRGEATQASLLALGGQGGGGVPRPVVCVGFDSARLAARFGATSLTAGAAVDLASSSALRLLIRTLPHIISSAPGGDRAPSATAATAYADVLPPLCAVARRALASLYDPNAAAASGGGGAAGGSILVADSAVASAKPESLRDLGTVSALLDLLEALLAGGAATVDAWMPLLLTAPVGGAAPSFEQLLGLRLTVDAAGSFVAEADCLVGLVAQAAAGLRERIDAGEASAKGGDGSAGGIGETPAAAAASKAPPASKHKKSKSSSNPYYSTAVYGSATLPKGPWTCTTCGSYNSKASGQSCNTCGRRRSPESAAAAAAEAAAAAVAAQAIVERLRPVSARLSRVDAQLQAAVQAWAAADPASRAVVAQAEGGAAAAALLAGLPASIAMGRAVSVEDTPQALASAVPPLAPLAAAGGAPSPLDPVLLVSAPSLLGRGDADSVVMARQLGISSVRDVYRVPGELRRRYEAVLRDETFDTVDGLSAGHEIVQVRRGEAVQTAEEECDAPSTRCCPLPPAGGLPPRRWRQWLRRPPAREARPPDGQRDPAPHRGPHRLPVGLVHLRPRRRRCVAWRPWEMWAGVQGSARPSPLPPQPTWT